MFSNVQIGIVIGGETAVDAAVAHRLIADDATRPYPGLEDARAAGCDFILLRTVNGLELCGPGDAPGQGVRADFESFDIRRRSGGRSGGGSSDRSRRQALGRAIGRTTTNVIDATAGLGYDSVRLACMGCAVTAIERSPVVAALLEDGLRRMESREHWPDIVRRVDVRIADAKTVLRCISLKRIAPVIRLSDMHHAVYIDPMYPPKRKASALPPKRVQYIRRIVGDDPDAGELLRAARAVTRRVVVKRPPYAEPLADGISHQIKTKLVRYDVYVSPSPPSRNEVS